MIPTIFAVYKHDTNSFQILQPEYDNHNNVIGLKHWNLADVFDDKSVEDEIIKNIGYMMGHEWYVVPTHPTRCIMKFYICDKPYYYWSLGYSLRLANAITFQHRFGKDIYKWENTLNVPILEFNTSTPILHSQGNPHHEANWSLAGNTNMVDNSQYGRMLYFNIVTQQLREQQEAQEQLARESRFSLNSSDDETSDNEGKNVLVQTRERTLSTSSTDSVDPINSDVVQFASILILVLLAVIYSSMLYMIFNSKTDNEL